MYFATANCFLRLSRLLCSALALAGLYGSSLSGSSSLWDFLVYLVFGSFWICLRYYEGVLCLVLSCVVGGDSLPKYVSNSYSEVNRSSWHETENTLSFAVDAVAGTAIKRDEEAAALAAAENEVEATR
ncbi:hypothetical protein MVEN_00048000 [Mycena venus]|uniref:Uncharacterized protein n=1 Tax=Mycena venus TaxID=2733690 RepID=A0A8H6Z3Z6_9AGAR|nr:hypothetical protein MVEN_00048000 [Mycena venus]